MTRSRGAFTLLEIILAIFLIGLISVVLIGGSARMLEDKPKTPDEIFWKAVQEARHEALVAGQDVQLSFDDKQKALVVGLASPTTFPIAGYDDLKIDFISMDDTGASNAMLVGGTLVETSTLPYVVFHDDGTCSRFRAQILAHGGAHLVDIDPWTCAPLLPAPKK